MTPSYSPVISFSDLQPPTLKIHKDQDVETWKHTSGYKNYGLFLRRLNESVVGYQLPLKDNGQDSESVTKTLAMLDVLNSWIDEIPPLPTPQRFGNLAFRSYGRKLEENSENLLHTLLPMSLHDCMPLITPYFLTSFGSFQRLDYGTGHETSFALFLYCLTVIGFFKVDPEEERRIVLRVFEKYLRLVWRLQHVYKLEPAGSHGVWGLDDYSFLGYVFGSGQLRENDDISPSIVLRPPLPPTNLYYMSIMRIHELKTGPFHEHSHVLHSIAQSVRRWSKVNSGMFKMYDAEVLGKRVVVQHLPLGGLIPWDPPNMPARTLHSSTTNSLSEHPAMSTDSPTPMTTMPWPVNPSYVHSSTACHSNRSTPQMPMTSAPWASGQSPRAMPPPPPQR